MNNYSIEQKLQYSSYFKNLRNKICKKFLEIEREHGDNRAFFEVEKWNRKGGGGGEISVLEGLIFEKIGVNISTVFGKFSEKFTNEISGAKENNGNFWASGISLIAHMNSPLIPSVHMNVRTICTSKSWFGGGIDLNPTYYNNEDVDFFCEYLKKICNSYDKNCYAQYKDTADKYFYIKHRKENRGIGGIFFDYLNSQNLEKDFIFVQNVGESLLNIFIPIIEKYLLRSYTKEQKEFQLLKRGRYVEFNLVYDRGTKFGLMTEGNAKAIMTSLPPLVKWSMFF